MPFMNRLLTSLILALFALPVLAQEEKERWYEVEIILFENLNPVSLDSERWPLEVNQPDLSNAVELLRSPADSSAIELEQPPATEMAVTSEATPVEPPQPEIAETKDPYLDTPYLILPAEQYRLNDAYQKLVDSENYLPLVHIAWRQPVPPREKPDRIYIHDKLNEQLDEQQLQGEEVTPESELELAPPPSVELYPNINLPELTTEPAIPEHTISGILSLGLGRYLHVEADLILNKPQQEAAVEEQPASPMFSLPEQPPLVFDGFSFEPMIEAKAQTPELFRIQGNLRMRSCEVHYLDHPLAGMLILFTPYEPPVPEVLEKIIETAPEQLQSNGKPNNGAIVRPGREPEDRNF